MGGHTSRMMYVGITGKAMSTLLSQATWAMSGHQCNQPAQMCSEIVAFNIPLFNSLSKLIIAYYFCMCYPLPIVLRDTSVACSAQKVGIFMVTQHDA